MTRAVALVGYGAWGRNIARTVSANSLLNLCAIVDQGEDNRHVAHESYPESLISENIEPVLASTEIDAVLIATPTTSHFHLVQRALEAGKHVFCEKALTTSVDEAVQLTELATQNQRVLMVGHIFMFNPGLAVLKNFMDEGRLGNVRYMAALRTNLGPVRQDASALVDLASHDISIMNHLMQALPARVSAVGQDFIQDGVEDVSFITLTYPNGAIGNIHVSWLNPRKERRLTVVGTERMAVWDDLVLECPIAIYEKKAETKPANNEFGSFLQVALSTGGIWMPPVPPVEPLKVEIQTFTDLISGSINKNPSDGNVAIAIAKVLQAAQQSMLSGGTPMEIH